jgi:hypothetical protein
MKKKIGLSAILLFNIPLISLAQEWGGEKPKGFWDHWSVNANIGFTSYFGDLSYYDTDITRKLSAESGTAVGVMVTKHFNKLIGVSGELIYGDFKGGNNKNISFKTELLEYNIQARLDFIRLILPNRSPKFGIEGHAGVGHLLFKSTSFEISEGDEKRNIYDTGVPEFVWFFGAGAHYHIGNNFAITAEISLHNAQNDKLDNLVKNNDFDYYSYLSLGLTYYIDNFKGAPLKNKARIAHSGIRKN